MTKFYSAGGEPVEHFETKFDACILRGTGKTYRAQAGSGRSEIIRLFFKDGVTIGEVTREAAAQGYDPGFVVSSLFKHLGSPNAVFTIEAPDGGDLNSIKASRSPRRPDPDKEQRREAAKLAREQKKADRTAAKDAKLAEREATKAAKKAAKEADLAARKAAKDAERAAAKAAASPEAEAPVDPHAEAEAPAKPARAAKGKGAARGKAARIAA